MKTLSFVGPMVLATLLVIAITPLHTSAQGYWLRVWDDNGYLTNVPPDLTNVVDVSLLGNETLLVLNADGTVLSWYASNSADPGVEPEMVPGLTDAVALDGPYVKRADGRYGSVSGSGWGSQPLLNDAVVVSDDLNGLRTAVIRSDGSIAAFQYGTPIPLPPEVLAITNAVDIVYFGAWLAVLTSEGTVLSCNRFWQDFPVYDYVWDVSWLSQTNVQEIASWLYLLLHDGTVAGSGVSNVVQISGAGHGMALRADGVAVSFSGPQVPLDLPYAVAVFALYDSVHEWCAALVLPDVAVTPPTILGPPTPASQTASVGSTVFFAVDAIGVPPLSYQWYFNGNPLLGETNTTLQLYDTTTADSGAYHVTVTNPAGQAVSDPAFLNVVTSLGVHIVPRLTLTADVGSDYYLEFINAIGPTNDWMGLDIVSITNNPQYYYDDSAIGQPQRFYRLSSTNAP